MAKHIHIWVETGRHLGKTKDAGPAHAPAGSSKGGQFVSGSGGGGGGASKSEPKYTPMKQANRNLEAKQLNESRQIVKRGTSPGVNPGVRQMQAKSDVEEARKRIAAKKKPAVKTTPMKQAEPEVAFRREMIAKNPRGTTFFYNNETKTTEAYHKGKLVGSLKDHS